VHLTVPPGSDVPRPGDVVEVEVSYAAPHHLVADGGPYLLRRTRAGDAWDRRQAQSCGAPTGGPTGGVVLGIPQLRPSS